MIDKTSQHLLEAFPRLDQAVLELALLVDQFLDPVFGIVHGANVHRTGNDFTHHLDLATQPAIINDQFTDIFKHQLQQATQAGTQFVAILTDKLQPVRKLLECRLNIGDILQTPSATHGDSNRSRLGGQLRLVLKLRGDSRFEGQHKKITQFRQELAGTTDRPRRRRFGTHR